MQQAHDVVEKVLKPWLEKHHPNADLVVMAGSFGRAMKNGGYQPIASSDVDMVILYRDLENGGFKAATQIFTMEEVGTALGEDKPRIMMIDTNILDFAALHYHDQVVRENKSVVFINVMLDEGYVLKDTLGIGPVIQQKAKEFLAEGPLPMSKDRWQSEISMMETFLKDIRAAGSAEEKQFLGAMALIHVGDFGLHLQDFWPRFNQAYRTYDQHFPAEGTKITEAFSPLVRNGESLKAEILLEEFIKRGYEKMEAAPDATPDILFSVKDHVPADEVRDINKTFFKFALEHYCEALEPSARRGELAQLSNLSAMLLMLKSAQADNDGVQPAVGAAAMHFLNDRLPNTLPAALDGLRENNFDGLRKVADHALADVGGVHYSRLENYYLDDIARVNAMAEKRANENNKPVQKPKFKPNYKL
jgi:hypothetical protein